MSLPAALRSAAMVTATSSSFDRISVAPRFVAAAHVFGVAMAGRHLQWPKTSWNGFHERSELLRQAGIEIPPSISDLGDAGSEDVLDAAAAAWSAGRIAAGTGTSLPAEATQFVNDRPLAIWY